MELKELMTAFAETLGIEGIEVKEGICSMTIDDIPMEWNSRSRPAERPWWGPPSWRRQLGQRASPFFTQAH